jgi:hypothetical protein
LQHGEPFSPKSRPNLPKKIVECLRIDVLPVLRVIASFSAANDDVIEEFSDGQPFASLKDPQSLLPGDSKLLQAMTLLRQALLDRKGEFGAQSS